jgi:hypothetical protein
MRVGKTSDPRLLAATDSANDEMTGQNRRSPMADKRYNEAASVRPAQEETFALIGEVLQELAKKGLIVDTGERRQFHRAGEQAGELRERLAKRGDRFRVFPLSRSPAAAGLHW